MDKKVSTVLLIVLLCGGQLPTYAQEMKKKIDKREFTELCCLGHKFLLPMYNHKEAIKQDQKEKSVNRASSQSRMGVLHSGRFWLLMAAIGGIAAGVAVAATSTSSEDSRTLPYPSTAMGPFDKN